MNKIKCPHCGENVDIQDSIKQEIQEGVKAQQQDQQKAIDAAVKAKEQEQQKAIDAAVKAKEQEQQQDQQKAIDAAVKAKEQEQQKAVDAAVKAQEQDQQKAIQEAVKANELLNRQKQASLVELNNQLTSKVANLNEDVGASGSRSQVQVSGEAAENIVQRELEQAFPDDVIEEVKRGKSGADWIIKINERKGKATAKIAIEVKNTKSFSNGWIPKLKADMKDSSIDTGVIITRSYPKNVDGSLPFFKQKNILICRMEPRYYISALAITRQSIIEKSSMIDVAQARKTSAPEEVFDYITSEKFINQMSNIWDEIDEQKSRIDKKEVVFKRFIKEERKSFEVIKNTLESSLIEIKYISPESDVGLPENIDSSFYDDLDD